ncbi:hypothetical protein SUDANB176_00225 [Streptomyces sp. enrichment culture]
MPNSSNRSTAVDPGPAARRVERLLAVCVQSATGPPGSTSANRSNSAVRASAACPFPHASGRTRSRVRPLRRPAGRAPGALRRPDRVCRCRSPLRRDRSRGPGRRPGTSGVARSSSSRGRGPPRQVRASGDANASTNAGRSRASDSPGHEPFGPYRGPWPGNGSRLSHGWRPVAGRWWADHRRTLEAIAWTYRTCSPWPAGADDADDIVCTVSVGSTACRAHQHAAAGKRGAGPNITTTRSDAVAAVRARRSTSPKRPRCSSTKATSACAAGRARPRRNSPRPSGPHGPVPARLSPSPAH